MKEIITRPAKRTQKIKDMKLAEILPEVVAKVRDFVNANEVAIEQYVIDVIAAHEYKDLDTRIAHDLFRACFSSRVVCGWYDQYNCNDDHLRAVVKRAYKASGADVIVSRVFNNLAVA